MQDRDVVGLGYCVYDYLAVVPHRPDFDTDTMALADFSTDGGGPVSTALVALARLGAHTAYIGVLGDDSHGQALAAMFAAEDVDCSRLRHARGFRSQASVILVEHNTGRRSIMSRRSNCPPLKLDDADLAVISSARALHLDGHQMDAALEAAHFAHSQGVLVSLDAFFPSDGLDHLLPHVDLLIASETFPSAYTDSEDIWEAVERLRAMGPEWVVVTKGERGCIWIVGESRGELAGFQVRAVDTTGAGDAFHGAFLFGHLHGWPLVQTAEFANAVAALNCTSLGGRSGLPTLGQALSFLCKHSAAPDVWRELTRKHAETSTPSRVPRC